MPLLTLNPNYSILAHNPIGILEPLPAVQGSAEDIQDYYREVWADYEAWSPKFNMHFGYYKKGLNPFRLESMLDQMNEEALDRLQLDPAKAETLGDFGCGMGATARHAALRFPKKKIKAITLVEEQVKRGRAFNFKAGVADRIEVLRRNYCHTGLPSASLDGTYALESVCHAAGPAKEGVIQEMYRLLKPGARFAIADAFVHKPASEFPPLLRTAYLELCRAWAVPEMGNLNRFVEALENAGFRNIQVEDSFWRVMPSAAHILPVTIKYLFQQLFHGKGLSKRSFEHVKACLLGIPVGLYRKGFGYYLITGEKPQEYGHA